MTQDSYSQRILEHMADARYRPKKVRELARVMDIAEGEYGDFRAAVKALRNSGRIVLGSQSALTLPEPGGKIVGSFRANPRGFGFVIPESTTSHGDLFVPPDHTMGAMTGDLVSARVVQKGKRGGRMIHEGRITKIIQRGQSKFVGALCRDDGRWFVRPDGNVLHSPIFVSDVGAKGASEGDQVVIEIIEYPSESSAARGVIAQVLGQSGDPEVDTLSIIHQYNFPDAFDERVLETAREVVADYDLEQAIEGREDLRDQTVITIDPDDARDFDDAISIRAKRGGQVELGVHIADVSYFVRPGSPLDEESRERGNSIYFPRHVIPMLPEILSNGLCSLQEGQPRLVKSAYITYDRRGEAVGQRFANSVISSAKRLTYRQASAVLEGKTGRISKPVVKLVCDMEKLAKAIEKRRLADGMIELDLPEVDLVFDDAGRVTGVTPADTSYSHKIIEMFMIEANEAVARLMVSKKAPHLRRVHPAPDAAAGDQLAKFLRAIGLRAPELEDRLAVQSLLRSVRNKPQSFAVNLAVLRSMQRAEYAPTLIGHFALASDDYAHFTSPIRRYPDLTVHRLLDEYVAGRLEGKDAVANQPSTAELKELGGHCSHQERRAEDAERELRLIKILRLLNDRVGEVLAGVVTGVTNFGVFVQLNEFHVDGLMKFDDLGDDWWEVDTTRGCVVGQRSGKRLSIGQSVKVAIAKVDISGRRLDLVLDGLVVSGGVKSPSKSRGGSRVTKVKRAVKKSPARRKGAKSRRSATTRRAVKRRGRG